MLVNSECGPLMGPALVAYHRSLVILTTLWFVIIRISLFLKSDLLFPTAPGGFFTLAWGPFFAIVASEFGSREWIWDLRLQ